MIKKSYVALEANKWRSPQRAKFVVGGAIVLAAMAYLIFVATAGSEVYWKSISDLRAQGPTLVGERLRIGGPVDFDSLRWDAETLTVRFNLLDLEDRSLSLPVVYRDVIPDTFLTSSGVILEGEYRPDGVFDADTMLVQCASKYEKVLEGEA